MPLGRQERFDEDVDILERADVPLYSSDDDATDADGLPNLPVLAKALLPPPLPSEAMGLPAVPAAAQPSAMATAGCDADHSHMLHTRETVGDRVRGSLGWARIICCPCGRPAHD